MWENTVPDTEFPCIFYVGIGLLQLSVVLVNFDMFKNNIAAMTFNVTVTHPGN